jgi:hypothetical protein
MQSGALAEYMKCLEKAFIVVLDDVIKFDLKFWPLEFQLEGTPRNGVEHPTFINESRTDSTQDPERGYSKRREVA